MDRENEDTRAAFQNWVVPHLEQAGGYACSIVGNQADAEDAVQEALWKGYRGLGGYDRARPFKGWWLAIVRNCCLDLLQQRRSRPATVEMAKASQIPSRPNDESEPLREAMSELSAAHCEILQLRYFGGCSYRELAEALRIPTGTVMSRLHAARLALAAKYGKD